MLNEQSQEAISKDDFVAKNKNIYDGIAAKNIAVTIGHVSDYNSNAHEGELSVVEKIVEYSVRMDTAAGEIAYSNHWGNILSDWRIHFIISLLGIMCRIWADRVIKSSC